MFGQKSEDQAKLDDAINRVLDEMANELPESDEYSHLLTQLERLVALTKQEPRKPISWDTLLTTGTTLLGILVIVTYEQKNVLASKALSLIPKIK